MKHIGQFIKCFAQTQPGDVILGDYFGKKGQFLVLEVLSGGEVRGLFVQCDWSTSELGGVNIYPTPGHWDSLWQLWRPE